MLFSPLRISAIAAVAMFTAVPAVAQSTTFLQFNQDTNAKLLHINTDALGQTITATNVPVDIVAQAFAPGVPFEITDAFFTFNASTTAPRVQVGNFVSRNGYSGSLSFLTGGGLNILSLTFDDALVSGFVGAVSGNFSTNSPPAIINATSDIFDLSRFVGGNFSLGFSALTTVIQPDQQFQGSGNVAGTFAGTVPEPATWGMMIMGFGLVGFTARHRRHKSQVLA